MYSVQTLCSDFLMANRHISFTCIMCVLKIHLLSTIIQGKIMENFNTVCSDHSFWCYIFLSWSSTLPERLQYALDILRAFVCYMEHHQLRKCTTITCM